MGYGAPQNGWFIMENTIKMDDDWGTPMTQETSMCKSDEWVVDKFD